MTFFKESQQRIASFSLKKSLTKRRLCEAYEKPQWKGLLKEQNGLVQWKDESLAPHNVNIRIVIVCDIFKRYGDFYVK